MSTTPLGCLYMTGRIAPNVREKDGFSGLDHFSTLAQACLMSVTVGFMSRLSE